VVRVVPLAVLGTSDMFPVGARQLVPGPVDVRFGDPIDVAAAGGPREALALAHAAVAALLPASRKPDPAEPALR
jgi:1-acyl-sn-glycerol-3-phosphate acyltransferase